MRRKQNLLFAFSLPLFFSLFLPHFFSLAGHLVAFIAVGKVFRNALRILGLGQVSGTRVFFFFFPFSLVSLTELCSFWYGLKDLFTLHKLADKVVLDH